VPISLVKKPMSRPSRRCWIGRPRSPVEGEPFLRFAGLHRVDPFFDDHTVAPSLNADIKPRR